MCRLLLVKSAAEFSIAEHLKGLASIAQNSKEYQGHGWGCAYVDEGSWKLYKNIKPVWDDDLSQFGRTTLLLGHARSAFKNEGIRIENNMPFTDGRYVFVFNGELRGVRISEQGRIGAEKIFNFIRRFDRGSMLEALNKGTELIGRRTRYIRAMNIIVAEPGRAFVSSMFNEEPGYFTLHQRCVNDTVIVASDPLPGMDGWCPMGNPTVQAIS